jgi:hypothetical protein
MRAPSAKAQERAPMLTLAQAAGMTGMSRSSIMRAINRGALTGTKEHNDVWHVDGAELARPFPVNSRPAQQDTHPQALAACPGRGTHRRAQGSLEVMRSAGEDAWKAQIEAITLQLALPSPQDAQPNDEPLRRTRRWLRSTG